MATGDKVYLRVQTRAHALSTGELRTKLVYNVYDFKRTTTAGTPSKQNALTAFVSTIIPPLQACLSVSYVTDFIDVRWVDDPLDPFYTIPLVANGTVSGDSLPSLMNVFLRLSTGLRGATNRGGKHYGPIAESDTLLDDLISAAVTRWGTFSTAYLNGMTASDGFVYKPFLVSQKKSTFNPTTATVIGNSINTTVLNPVLGRMTKRAQFTRSAS